MKKRGMQGVPDVHLMCTLRAPPPAYDLAIGAGLTGRTV